MKQTTIETVVGSGKTDKHDENVNRKVENIMEQGHEVVWLHPLPPMEFRRMVTYSTVIVWKEKKKGRKN